LSFFFTLFGAFEFAGEKIVHDQSGDKSGDAKILLRVVAMHVKAEVIAAIDKSRKKFVYPVLLFVSPQADGIQQPATSQTQITTRLDSARRGEELPQIGVIKIRISIFV
jgi:hypothetical protein